MPKYAKSCEMQKYAKICINVKKKYEKCSKICKTFKNMRNIQKYAK